ncbi:MAG TPA: hypothetical protein VKN99_13915 [Polyangia bacterium]|nr:hypothetical protein [Polyangia bacterium]
MHKWLLVALTMFGCGKAKAVPKGPEQDLVAELGNALAADPRKVTALWDVEIRQQVDLFEDITRAPGTERVKMLEAAQPRLGEAAALDTLRAEVSGELFAAFRVALVKGGCVWGPPAPGDLELYTSKHELPKPKPEMGQHIGQFLFDLQRQIGYITSGRVTCPDGTSAWVQLVKRKGGGNSLRILRVGK